LSYLLIFIDFFLFCFNFIPIGPDSKASSPSKRIKIEDSEYRVNNFSLGSQDEKVMNNFLMDNLSREGSLQIEMDTNDQKNVKVIDNTENQKIENDCIKQDQIQDENQNQNQLGNENESNILNSNEILKGDIKKNEENIEQNKEEENKNKEDIHKFKNETILKTNDEKVHIEDDEKQETKNNDEENQNLEVIPKIRTINGTKLFKNLERILARTRSKNLNCLKRYSDEFQDSIIIEEYKNGGGEVLHVFPENLPKMSTIQQLEFARKWFFFLFFLIFFSFFLLSF